VDIQKQNENLLKSQKEKYESVVAELLSGEMTPEGIENLVSIRIRDGVMHFALENPELRETMIATLSKLAEDSEDTKVKVTAKVIKAGFLWLDGKQDETVTLVNDALQMDSSYSLAQLLDIAIRHDVPSIVWARSLEAVSLDACLLGAG
jgi:hypothetical protein